FVGSHYVTAHNPPDLDTMVASFWSWLDAFAARVSKGLHIWNLPGGEPPQQMGAHLRNFFGQGVFRTLARSEKALTPRALDLITKGGKGTDVDAMTKLSDLPKGSHSVGIGDIHLGVVEEIDRELAGTVSL